MVLSVAGCAKIDDGSNAETAGNVAVEHIEQDLLAQRRKSGHCTCGGRLKSKYVYKEKTCPYCYGKGYHVINGKREDCTLCHSEPYKEYVGEVWKFLLRRAWWAYKRQATYWFKKSAEQGGNIILSMCRAECI